MRHKPLGRVLIRAAHAAAEPAAKGGILARHQDIRLQRREPARLHLLAQRRNRIPRINRRRPQNIVMPYPRAAAMRPIHPHLIARRPPEQLRHRNPQRLRLNVNERAIQPRDSLRRDAPRTLPRNAIHILKPHLKRARILPNQQRLHIPNSPLYPMRRPPIAALPPARNPLIRLHLHKHPRPPPRIHDKRLYIRNLHLRALPFGTELPHNRAYSPPIIPQSPLTHITRPNPKVFAYFFKKVASSPCSPKS